MRIVAVVLLTLFAGLLGCEVSPNSAPRDGAPPKAELQFVDLPGFDNSLADSLAAPLPRVQVGFYDHVAPSTLPERLQNWLAAVENAGGTVKVIPPKPEVTSRNPLLIVSALSSLWTASKIARELAARQKFKTAQFYDAELQLKVGDNGRTVVDKVVFVQRQR